MAARKNQEDRKVVVISRSPNGNWARIHYGTLVEMNLAEGTATLSNARQCLYYSKDTGGEVGLAAIGPAAGSRLSSVAPGELHVTGVATIQDASAEATTKWEA